MSFGFRIFSNAIKSPNLIASYVEIVRLAEEKVSQLQAEVWAIVGELYATTAAYGRKPVVALGFNTWREAEFFIATDRTFIADWVAPNTRSIKLGRTPAEEVVVNTALAGLLIADANKIGPRLTRAISAYNDAVRVAGFESSRLATERKSARIPRFDSTSVTWSQVDMFLVPAGLTTQRSYPNMGFREFRATQMFVNSHPKDGVGAAGKGIAAYVVINGSSVSVSGGNRDTYIMVVAQ
jgi:hypothetical protein